MAKKENNSTPDLPLDRKKITSVAELFRGTLNDYRANWRKFAYLLVLPLLVTFIASLVSYSLDNFVGNIAWSWQLAAISAVVFLALLLAFITWFALTYIAEFLLIDDLSQEINFGNLREWYGRAKPFFWIGIAVTLVYTFLAFLGIILLIVPGLIFAVSYCFAIYAVIFEGSSFEGAFGRSRELVRGYWWAVFGRFCAGIAALYVAYLIIGAVVAGIVWLIADALQLQSSKDLFKLTYDLLSIFIGIVVGPLTLLYTYKIYQSLKTIKTN